MKDHRHGLRATLLLGGLLVAGCSSIFATKIADIVADPRKYEGTEVTVAGEVTDTTNLLFAKYFAVSDGSGEIIVVTERPLPREGEKVSVKGTVHEAFAIGDNRLLVVKERTEPR
jgi:hypothetical protein